MSRFRTISTATALVTCLVVALTAIGAASAAPSHWERYVFEYGPEPSFCDGLIQHGVVTGMSRVTQHGDGLFYYYDEGEFTETWTNPDDPEDFATVISRFKQSALAVTDNGDGTYQVLFAGPARPTFTTATPWSPTGPDSPALFCCLTTRAPPVTSATTRSSPTSARSSRSVPRSPTATPSSPWSAS